MNKSKKTLAEESGNQSTLVIKLGALGDMVQAVPLFDVIRQQFGDSLTLLTTKPFVDFAERTGYFKTIICDDRTSMKTTLRMLLDLRKMSFKRIIDAQNVDRTNLYRLLLSTRSTQWITTSCKNRHPYHRYKQLCANQGWSAPSIVDLRRLAEPINLPKSPCVLIVAGASNAKGGLKKWPQENYAALCRRLMDKGITPVLIGSNADNLSQLQTLCAENYVGLTNKTVDLIGQTSLYQLITLGMHAIGAIGNDTGPLLMIAATGCSTLTLFSKVNPPNKGGAWPWDDRHRSIYAENLNGLSIDDVWQKMRFCKDEPH